MKKTYTLLLMLFFITATYAQQNTIKNPDFEDGTTTDWTLDLGVNGAATMEVVDDPLTSSNSKVLKLTVTTPSENTSKPQMVRIVSNSMEYTDAIEDGDLYFDYSFDYYSPDFDGTTNLIWGLCFAEGIGNTQNAGKPGVEWKTQAVAAKALVRDPANTANPIIHIEVPVKKAGTYYFDNFRMKLVGIATAVGDNKESYIKVWSSNQAIIISNQTDKVATATIYDISGRQIKQAQLAVNNNVIEMTESGLYIIKSEIGGDIFTNKVVIP
ncbi:T9SS type A sorting domain-containing protein [Labilibacter sediminis]|nr:T9SS type A sorting domain-containing protein [Labilibacter sediminis]